MGQDLPSALFSLIVSLGCIPAIRASPNGAAALVAEKLANRIKKEIVCSRRWRSGLVIESANEFVLLQVLGSSCSTQPTLDPPRSWCRSGSASSSYRQLSGIVFCPSLRSSRCWMIFVRLTTIVSISSLPMARYSPSTWTSHLILSGRIMQVYTRSRLV